MDAQARMEEAHDRIRGIMKIVTNVMTHEGRKITVAWNHYSPLSPGSEPTRCLVMADTLDEALRKVIDLEDQFEEGVSDTNSDTNSK